MSTLKLTLFLCFSLFLSNLFIFSLSADAELCNPDDKRALLAIKHSFGDPYLIASWKNDTDCCKDWYQVECDPTNHRIISLTIFSGQLSGKIPAAVGDLPYLQTLLLRKLSNLTGPIPNAIAKLTNLKMVRLSWTNLSGPVPSFFSGLKNLEYLDLSFNNLSGSIPPSLSELPNLQTLHLDRNQLTGSIPESFGSFKQSDFYIYLSHNRLTGSIPSTLGRVNFTVLDFSRNQLSRDASFLFGKNKELQQIDLSRNLLEFNMTELEFDANLISIDLNHNKIYGNIPASLADVPQLQFLNVSYNRLCGPIPTGGQLNRFDQYSYVHNRCLCGTPLPACQ